MSNDHHVVQRDVSSLSLAIKDESRRLGFELVGIAPAVSPSGFNDLKAWLARGYAGEMSYMQRREAAYEHPGNVLLDVKSVIMLAANYKTEGSPEVGPTEGLVAKYAWGELDYHDFLREKLKRLADFLHSECPGCRTRGVVDTAPLLERDFARLAGLGWFGKNTVLINKRMGSWLFLAALLTDLKLEYDQPHETAHCGTCTRCLDACPTDAFPEPYVLDANKCISYLTIELRDVPIPEALRQGMGEWLFGCDICQDVCPWNRKAPASVEPNFQPIDDLAPANAAALLKMTDEEFEQRFRSTPLSRPRRNGMLRNAAIVLGNSRDSAAVLVLSSALDDSEVIVRGAVAWALGQIGSQAARTALQSRLAVEDNDSVKQEIHNALTRIEKTT